MGAVSAISAMGTVRAIYIYIIAVQCSYHMHDIDDPLTTAALRRLPEHSN